MAEHAVFFGFLAVASGLFALVEIQIEGPNGWAERLPTWRIENQWTRLFCGRRPLTGYHLYVLLFVLLIVHLPYALSLVTPSLKAEFRILAFLILFWMAEDFLCGTHLMHLPIHKHNDPVRHGQHLNGIG